MSCLPACCDRYACTPWQVAHELCRSRHRSAACFRCKSEYKRTCTHAYSVDVWINRGEQGNTCRITRPHPLTVISSSAAPSAPGKRNTSRHTGRTSAYHNSVVITLWTWTLREHASWRSRAPSSCGAPPSSQVRERVLELPSCSTT